MLKMLKKQEDDEKMQHPAANSDARTVPLTVLADIFAEDSDVWTPKIFTAFLNQLGADQLTILSLLVTKRRVTYEDLGAAVKVDNNQALAGIISGISKQAAALSINPRAVFGIENHRRAGELTKVYFVDDRFREFAEAMKWPHPPKTPREKHL